MEVNVVSSPGDASITSDRRLLDAASNGQTDLILQILEEDPQAGELHRHKDQVFTNTNKSKKGPFRLRDSTMLYQLMTIWQLIKKG